MFKVKTVIILGAGASMPYDFQAVKDLKFAISDALNWDRLLEYFIYNPFMKSLRLDSGQSINLMKCIPVIYVYGELGLPRFHSTEGRAYATTVTTEDIRKCIEGIKIMPEAEEIHSGFNQVHQILSEAKNS